MTLCGILKNTALMLLSLLTAASLGELFLRLGGYKMVTFYPLAGFHQFDPDLGWAQIPDHAAFFKSREFEVRVESNSYGFRDDDYPLRKPAGVERVVVLGDSYAWGWGVEQDEIFCEVAEARMEGVEFINLGHNAYGTAQEYLILKKLGMKFSPDLTVLAFYYNDIYDNIEEASHKPRFGLEDGDLVYLAGPRPFSPSRKAKAFFSKHSLLFHFIDYRIAQILKARGEPKGRFIIPDCFHKDHTEETSYAWDLTAAILRRTDELTEGRFVVVYIPTRFQVEEDSYRDALESSGVIESDVDRLGPNVVLKCFCEEQGISFLDLTPALSVEYEEGVHVYFEHDGHLSAEGHEVAGRELVGKVRELLAVSGL
jgi:hypothetical protein